MKKRVVQRIIFLISIFSVILAVALVAYNLNQPQEKVLLHIEAAHDVKGNGMPVFAQFVFKQTFKIKESHAITRLVVPIYFPLQSEWLQIDLRQNNKLVQRWRYRPQFEDSTMNIDLPITAPLKLKGDAELIFSGRHIPHEQQDRAPRLFIETADDNFPDGNYWIAENKKSGDISMNIYEEINKWSLLKQKLAQRPLEAVIKTCQLIILLLALAVVPFILYRIAGKYKDIH